MDIDLGCTMKNDNLNNCIVNSENLRRVIDQVSIDHVSFQKKDLAAYVGIEQDLLVLLMEQKRLLRDGITKKIVEFLKGFKGYEGLSDGLSDGVDDAYLKQDSSQAALQLDEDIAKLRKLALIKLSRLDLVNQDLPTIKFDELASEDALHYIDLARTLSKFLVKLGRYTDLEFISTEKFDDIVEQLTLMRVHREKQ